MAITQEVNIEMLEKLPDGNFKVKYPKTKAENIIDLARYATTTGSANTYVADILGISNLVAGLRVTVKINVANTGASTINVSGLGAKSIRKSGETVLSAGNLKVGGVYSLVYDGTNFILQGEGGEYGTAVASDVLASKTIGTENGLVQGTMPSVGKQVRTLYKTDKEVVIRKGYHNGEGVINAYYPNTVESVQQGVTVGSSEQKIITINNIDISRSILLLTVKSRFVGGNSTASYTVSGNIISSTQIGIQGGHPDNTIVNWTLIQFRDCQVIRGTIDLKGSNETTLYATSNDIGYYAHMVIHTAYSNDPLVKDNSLMFTSERISRGAKFERVNASVVDNRYSAALDYQIVTFI